MLSHKRLATEAYPSAFADGRASRMGSTFVYCLYQESNTGSRVPLINAVSQDEAVALGKMLSYLNAAPVVACAEDDAGDPPVSLRFMAGQLLRDAPHAAKAV